MPAPPRTWPAQVSHLRFRSRMTRRTRSIATQKKTLLAYSKCACLMGAQRSTTHHSLLRMLMTKLKHPRWKNLRHPGMKRLSFPSRKTPSSQQRRKKMRMPSRKKRRVPSGKKLNFASRKTRRKMLTLPSTKKLRASSRKKLRLRFLRRKIPSSPRRKKVKYPSWKKLRFPSMMMLKLRRLRRTTCHNREGSNLTQQQMLCLRALKRLRMEAHKMGRPCLCCTEAEMLRCMLASWRARRKKQEPPRISSLKER
mmetsp:Transcript_47516/g.112968  ORF Transcript_47516/g.112968 Transcript_47516/m.112968 type:complete len:253 (-) Transcript_47516:1554-2312(-)